MELKTATIIHLRILDEEGEVIHDIGDAQITEVYRLNDLGFWIYYWTPTSTNEAHVFIGTGNRLEIVCNVLSDFGT